MNRKCMILYALCSAIFPLTAFASTPEEVALQAMEGYSLFMRDSLPDDRRQGYEMMLLAAWEGDAKAANNVGWILQHGEFDKKDLQGALRWYERAADQNLPVAALNYIDLILNNTEDVVGDNLPDREFLAKASALAGTSLLMGRGLPYDSKLGESMLLRSALWGNKDSMMTIAQQLEMYPDSFSYLPLEEIAAQCDELLQDGDKNVPAGMGLAEFADLMLSPSYWYERIEK